MPEIRIDFDVDNVLVLSAENGGHIPSTSVRKHLVYPNYAQIQDRPWGQYCMGSLAICGFVAIIALFFLNCCNPIRVSGMTWYIYPK